VDYFRCASGQAVWNVPKDKDGPVQTVAIPKKPTRPQETL
jgi:hypothetical protein